MEMVFNDVPNRLYNWNFGAPIGMGPFHTAAHGCYSHRNKDRNN